MSIIPAIKRCPCCDSVNLIRVNGVAYDNPFKNLKNWILRKKFNCRKCKEELGLFSSKSTKLTKSEERLIWLNNLNIEENYFSKLNLLEKRRAKLAKAQSPQYFETLKDIEDIENQIHSDKIKLKIKFKIQKKGMLT